MGALIDALIDAHTHHATRTTQSPIQFLGPETILDWQRDDDWTDAKLRDGQDRLTVLSWSTLPLTLIISARCHMVLVLSHSSRSFELGRGGANPASM